MAVATAVAISGVQQHSFPLFFAAYMVVFLCSGAMATHASVLPQWASAATDARP
jgi:hypothetical protein